MLLAIAAILDWEIHVIDINSAFINCECLKTKQSIFPNLLATLLRVRKTLSGNLAKHSMALNNLVTSGTRNLKAFLSRLVSRHANLIHVFLFAHHSQQPPSSHLMLMILDSIVIHFLKSTS